MNSNAPLRSLRENQGHALALVNCASRQSLLEDIQAHFRSGTGFTVATLNLDHITKLHRIPEFHQAYWQHSHVVADGNPIVWLRRIMGQPVELVPGSELVEPLAELATQMDMPVALLGATPETLALAAERLQQAMPGLKVVEKIAPPFGFDPNGTEADYAIARLSSSGARLCFLALGAPKQEVFAARAAGVLPSVGFLSIGAGLDFIAGTQKRAPTWVRRIAMEWLWRMASNPARLALRYGGCVVILPGLFFSALKIRQTSDTQGG